MKREKIRRKLDMVGYKEIKDIVAGEINTVLDNIDKKKIEELISLICRADKVFVVGTGRTLLMLQAFVKRLNHIGIKAYYAGEINEPPITGKDILIAGSGSGKTIIPVSIAKIAKQYNAKIIYIGSNPKSPVCKIADLFIKIPCKSRQLMNSLFEQGLLLLCDIICFIIAGKKNMDIKKLLERHANLE